jgi:hypothetical protein
MNPAALERALQDYVSESQAAALLGVTRQAVNKKPDQIKRRMGGIPGPGGWLFHRETLLRDAGRAESTGEVHS